MVYERDPSPDFRPQSGTLDVHFHSGQHALCDAGLFDEFLKHAHYDGQATRFLTKAAAVVHEPQYADSAETARPEIDRTVLRHTLASVEFDTDNKYKLHFKDDKVESGFDLVIGADGAWSRLEITDPRGNRYDVVNELVRRDSAFGFGDQKCLIAQRLGTHTIRVYAGFGADGLQASWVNEEFEAKDPQGSKAKALALFEGWNPAFLDLLRLAGDLVVPRQLYMLPVDHTWKSRPGLTLLGDAAHLMTPFAGEGVNMALWDSLELSKKVIEGIQAGDMNKAIRGYEVGLFERGGNSMKKTDQNKQAFSSKNFQGQLKSFRGNRS